MGNSKKKKKKSNNVAANSQAQVKKQTAVQTAKPAKAQNIETKQETVNTQTAVEKKEPAKAQNIENKQDQPHEFKDPRKVPPKEDLKIEDKLEFATMSRKERRAAKRKRLKETTEGMTFVQKLQYFLYAYKMEILVAADRDHRNQSDRSCILPWQQTDCTLLCSCKLRRSGST